ncbi:MAG: sulfatase-like hydrolase/transferase [Planctomycetota bacterium]
MNRRDFLKHVGVAGATAVMSGKSISRAQGQSRPNILFIIADDLGYSDLSCYGGKDIDTPNLDRLATEGVRLTSFYTAAPMCAPTRESIMSGRYPLRTGHTWPSPTNKGGLLPADTTLAEVLKGAGYRTCCVGKWHLGYPAEMHPRKQGFDEFYGVTSGSADYYKHVYKDDKKWFFRQEEICNDQGYMTDLLTNEAVAILERQTKEQPFFLYLAYNAPHLPDQAPEEYMKSSRCGAFGAMVKCMEDGIGRVLDALEKKGLRDNTLVIFTSDNGGRRVEGNKPLRGGKGSLWEGGIRVPFIARWPGHITPGSAVGEMAITTDLFTTLALIGGGKLPEGTIDGKDILPMIQGKAKTPHEYLCWRWRRTEKAKEGKNKSIPISAIRRGNMKLLRGQEKEDALYDLDADIGETKNLIKEKPEVARELGQVLDKWIADAWDRKT